jgi:O-antigen/teichoic acid export membrane protein
MRSIGETISGVTSRFHGSSLKARGARGATILGVATVGERTFRFVRNMLLARILAPEAFGTMAMVVAVSSVFETFSDVGVRQSIIQNKTGAEKEYLNVAWWFQSLRGFGLYILAVIVSPWVSRFYDLPELLPLLKVSFITMIVNGLTSPRVYVLEKRLQFGRYVILTQGSGLLGTLLTIGLAFYLRNVWALVIGLVAEAAVRCILSFILCPMLPQLSIDRESLKKLIYFAKGIFGLSFLTVIISQIPVFVLGKVASGVQLGMYYMVFQLAEQPVQLFDRVVGRVLLPAFAEKQDNKESICRVLLAMARTIGILGIPLLAFVGSCAGLILSVVYGSKYAEAAIPFSLLCVWGLIFTQAINLSSILLGLGLPCLHRRAVALRGLLLASLIYPCTVYWGLSGAAAAVLVAYSVGLIMPLVWMRKLIGLDLTEYMRSWLPGLLLSGFVFIPIGLVNITSLRGDGTNVVVAGLAYLVVVAIGAFYLNRRYKLI